ncbi:protein kinase [Streptomyces sp. NBC_01613]|uniref:serine/threonine-protein kinase n=1 Tax=Streptomyces sp. NBC_01613 TaxID=2975896 RepID=UPI0038662A1B
MTGETPDQGEGRIINGRYRLLRSLGAGGMGRVWLAHDEELACDVAMKEIALPDEPMDAGEPAQRIARARSEARHAARLRGHPHVATVHDVVVHEGLPWIVMEYVPDAVDLEAVVRRSGPLSPAQAARIGLGVLDALTAGHRIGILHRDVKPANILLASDASGDPYARVLLTDYGIALQPESHEPRLTATAGILGTPGYLAPERARGEPPTPAADLFSLGATLYAAVEGRGPFDRHGDYATLTALLGEEPTPSSRAGELAPVLQGLLVKDPVRRSSPETVARGLERVVSVGFGASSGAWGAGAAAGGFGSPSGVFGPPPEGFGAVAASADGRGGRPGGSGAPEAGAGAGGTPGGTSGAPGGSGASGHPAGEERPPGDGGSAPPGYGQGVPPGYVGGPPPGYVGGPPPGDGASAPPGYGQRVPPGYVEGPPPGYVEGSPSGGGGSAPPEYGQGVPPGYGEGSPPGYAVGSPPGRSAEPYAGRSGDPTPGTPQTPGAPPTPHPPTTPHTPQTPHTPAGGGPDTPGAPGAGQGSPAGPATPAGASGPPPYDVWRQPSQQHHADPANPYAQAPGAPYAGGGAQPPYAGGGAPPPIPGGATPPSTPGNAPPPSNPASAPSPPYAGSATPPPYAGGAGTPAYGEAGTPPPYAGGAGAASRAEAGASTPYGEAGHSSPYSQSAGSPPHAEAGSPPPYAGSGGAPPSAQPPYATGAPGGYWSAPTASGTGGPSLTPPPPAASPGKRRLAIVALVVGAVLVVAGGAWGVVSLTSGDHGGGKNSAATKKSPSASAASRSPSPTGPVLPYGDVVGLSEPLQTGDCVKAVWSGTPFRSAPNLGVVDCVDDWPDGQVVAVDTATDYADARDRGAKRCESQSEAVVDALPDADGYAVLPTKEGFTAADSGTACLVLGRHAAIGGEVGRFRDAGTDLWVGQMSVGDCWDYKEVDDGYQAPLTDCAKPHTDQVIGAVQAPDKMSYKKGTDNATKLCGNKFESTWAPGSERVVYGWVADQDDWDRGFSKVVCTVSRSDGKKTTGKIPVPGSV